jgi:RNA polymerase-binding transcription factor DksA
MKTPPRSTASRGGRSAKAVRTKKGSREASSPQIPKRWRWHYEALARQRDRLIAERSAHLREGAEPVERHSLHQADSATDEFGHELALSQLSAEQDALYEVEAAMKRIANGGYGVCEQTGKRIPATRLKAVPWTRFREAVEARLEGAGVVPRPGLGKLRSLRDEPAAALAEKEPTVEEPRPVEPAESAAVEPTAP